MNEITTVLEAGLILTATLVKNGVVVNINPIPIIESELPGFYSGSMPTIEESSYVVLIHSAGVIVASGVIYWDGTKEITPVLYSEIHKIHGLDSSTPLTTTTNAMRAGEIYIGIKGNGETYSLFTRE